ncbi:MAG: hemolysin family protein [Deltaproteobacteria bacterium]|nr:hemolysin family protein [Deltaproteobacteria bacterium]
MDDPSSSILILLILLALLLVLSGFFSGTETALFALNPIERRQYLVGKSLAAQMISRALRRPRELLSTILFGNTLVNVATAAVATLLFERLYHAHSLIVAITVDTALVLILGEIIPKTVSMTHARAIAQVAIFPLEIFGRISRPFVHVFDVIARSILRLLHVPEEAGGALSPSELNVLFEEAGRRATFTAHETEIIRNIMSFSETTAAEVMTPRGNIAAAASDSSRQSLEEIMVQARHSRIPVYEGSINHIVGFVSTKEFFLNPERELQSLLKPVAVFPEMVKIDRVFRHMQKNHLNMAVIVNEYGETSGIATVEDIVEEIVGEIYDEYEKAEELIRPMGADEWHVLCRVSVGDLNKICRLSLSEGGSVTLNGYLTDEFGGIPGAGWVMEREGVRFTVMEATHRRVVSCRIKQLPKEVENVA